jgi:hypothetical protein
MEQSTISQTDYHAAIVIKTSAMKAYNAISQVSRWWTENTLGDTENLNGIFTVTFGETFSRFKIVELIPGEKILWQVMECNLHWMKDKKEWKDTRILWQISALKDSTQIDMTHVGLNAGIECFEDCTKGWNHYVKESLFSLLAEGKGVPDHKDYSALNRQ